MAGMADRFFRGIPDLAALAEDLRGGLFTGYFLAGVVTGVVVVLAAQSVFGRRCDRCGR